MTEQTQTVRAEHELLQKTAPHPGYAAPAIDHELLRETSFFRSLDIKDGLYAAVILAIAVLVQLKIPHRMDGYETAILWLSAAASVGLGWFFKPLRWFIPAAVALAYLAVGLYDGDISRGDSTHGRFLLRYLLASQPAIMWQCALTLLAFFAYSAGTAGAWLKQRRQPESSGGNILLGLGDGCAWTAALAGFTGLLVRWHESYLLRPNDGHIPVSNLYEVFILFMVITALMYQYYSRKFSMQKLGAFVYFLMCVLVGFVLWYSLERGAHEIRPLIPALQSWWMKLHVPANFIGYGAFCIAAMFAAAELLALHGNRLMPPAEQIEEAMYKVIAVGFLFFTIATILGALWADDAWGRYWSWDPKETWALIVWLNYAIWLHLRLVAGWRGKVLAWWALVGLLITAFAFVGVNMFLGGLHSYGEL